jgi:hypothetical protein
MKSTFASLAAAAALFVTTVKGASPLYGQCGVRSPRLFTSFQVLIDCSTTVMGRVLAGLVTPLVLLAQPAPC